ncbi:MAG: hypothetical protein NZ874_06835 [Fimbriimonadales bacterium]|nr:hypothetical protein [Fimbriimonadales bacterium]
MESLLADILRTAREQLLRSESDNDTLRELSVLLRDLSVGWSHLPEEARASLQPILQSALPLNEGASAVLLEELSAHQKLIGRAAAQAQATRYPAPRTVQRAYENLSLTRSEPDTRLIETLLTAAALVEPHAEPTAQAELLMRTLYAGQPFPEYNASVAALLGLAFLHANGATVALSNEQAEQLIGAIVQQSALHLPAVAGQPDPRGWDDILDELTARYREPFTRAEHALQQSALVRVENLPETVRATLQPAPGPSSEWRYLTLQDLIWINSELMKSPQPYDYDRLEEATYYQYSYRQSRDVLLQAARFLWGYLKYRPFARGNLATALIATLAFLQVNGYETRLPVERAAEWIEQVAQRRKHPLDAVRQISAPALAGTRPESLRELAHHLMEHYEPALHQLGER